MEQCRFGVHLDLERLRLQLLWDTHSTLKDCLYSGSHYEDSVLKRDLVSKFLGFLRQPKSKKKPSGQCLPIDDDLFQLFSELSKPSVFILDNADDLQESSCLKVKEEVIRVLEEILRQDQRVTFVVTTRESLEFMDVHFQGHHGLRIRPLDEVSFYGRFKLSI